MVKFGSYAQVEFRLDEYTNKQRLLDKLNANNVRRLDDETNIAAGLRLMRSSVFTRRGDRPTVNDIGASRGAWAGCRTRGTKVLVFLVLSASHLLSDRFVPCV